MHEKHNKIKYVCENKKILQTFDHLFDFRFMFIWKK